jgi:hypothetical protein
MPIMRIQFSLATLLICMTVLAVVCAAAVAFPVKEKIMRTTQVISPSGIRVASTKVSDSRPPTGWDIMRRMTILGTPATAATLAVLWAIRRLKSRRHTEPPVA